MIRLERGSLKATQSLTKAKAALDATSGTAAGKLAVEKLGPYAYKSMSKRLCEAQYQKCAYCEAILKRYARAVEHIRPQELKSYWWLKYSLENLVAACSTCNGIKKNKWVVEPESGRLKPRQQPWAPGVTEPARFVDPTVDEPADHLAFEYAGEMWRIASLSDEGAGALGVLELDRDDLIEDLNRYVRKSLDPWLYALTYAKQQGDTNEVNAIEKRLMALQKPTEEYSALTTAVVAAFAAGEYSPTPP